MEKEETGCIKALALFYIQSPQGPYEAATDRGGNRSQNDREQYI